MDEISRSLWLELDHDDILMALTSIKDIFPKALDIICIDYLSSKPRFDLVYLLKHNNNLDELRVKTKLGPFDAVPSLMRIYPETNWMEREVFDQYGLSFRGHTQLERLIFPGDFTGHPGRKDFDPSSIDDPTIINNPSFASPPLMEESQFSYSPMSRETMQAFSLSGQVRDFRVHQATIRMGHHHKGVEKDLETVKIEDIYDKVGNLSPRKSPLLRYLWWDLVRRAQTDQYDDQDLNLGHILNKIFSIDANISILCGACRAMGAHQKLDTIYQDFDNATNSLVNLDRGLPNDLLAHKDFVATVKTLLTTATLTHRQTTSLLNGYFAKRRISSIKLFDKSLAGYLHDIEATLVADIDETTHALNTCAGRALLTASADSFTWSLTAGQYYSSTILADGEFGIYTATNDKGYPIRLRLVAPSLVKIQSFPSLLEGQCFEDLPLLIASQHIDPFELDR